MKLTQLLLVTAAVALLGVAACNRPEARDNARVAAAEVKQVAGRAGEKLADSWLATKIQAQYFADDDIKARNILVSARDGVVTLKGRVDSPDAHDQALQIARNTDGVVQVNDQLTTGAEPAARAASRAAAPANTPVATSGITPSAAAPFADRLNDSGITASVQSKYFLDPNIKARRIEVDTRQGVVTLRGEVASDDERAQALILARTTEGVERVEDALTVNAGLVQPLPSAQLGIAAPQAAAPGSASAAVPSAGVPPTPPNPAQAADATLTTELESKIAADNLFKSAALDITAKDGVVLLEGTVPSAAAKQRALKVVRETKGVLQVVDRLKVGRSK
jgi:hyperosmotically inducible periplasmic protein